MFAFGARKLVIPSGVVQMVQTSAIRADVITSFRSILGSTKLTFPVSKVRALGYGNHLALSSLNRKTLLLTVQLSVHEGASSEGHPFENYARWKWSFRIRTRLRSSGRG